MEIVVTSTSCQDDLALAPHLSVILSQCVECVGVGLVPTERALPLLPAPFRLPDDSQPVTPLVVLAQHCAGIAVDGQAPQGGILVEVGLLVVPPDGSGDVNAFTLWSFTTDAELASSLQRLGLDAQHIPAISFEVSSDGTSATNSISVPYPGHPSLMMHGTVTPADMSNMPGAPGPFVANWWGKVDSGLLKLETHVPEWSPSPAQLTVTTSNDSPLGQLIGGISMGFPVLQNGNVFAYAATEVRVIPM